MRQRLETLLRRYHIRDYKFTLVILVTVLAGIGVLAVGSAQPSLQNRQFLGVVLGVIAMVILSLIDYQWLMNLYWLLYTVNIGLLVSVLLFGNKVNGARRWLDLGFTTFQPSDLTKIIIIIFFAKFFMDRERRMHEKKVLIEAILLMIPSLILIHEQPNLSNTICLAALFCLIVFTAGLSYKFIAGVLAVVLPVGIIFISIVVQPDQKLLEPYQQRRILAWLEPEKYSSDDAYQQLNSVMAIGSGQLTGKGLDNNTTTSVKNGNFISEPQTDFIFAIIGEELGFVGCCIVIILLLLIVIECILIGLRAKDMGGRLICCGVAALIGTQSFINISVATMIFPNTGLSLPFVSYGLTSVICFFMGIGIVLNVGLQPNKYQ